MDDSPLNLPDANQQSFIAIVSSAAGGAIVGGLGAGPGALAGGLGGAVTAGVAWGVGRFLSSFF